MCINHLNKIWTGKQFAANPQVYTHAHIPWDIVQATIFH